MSRIQECTGLRLAIALLRFGLIVAPGLSHAAEWKTYANDRFGQSADFPAGWKMQPPPENDDGRIFVSPDGKAKVIIFGNWAMQSRAEEMADALAPHDGRTVTYSKRGANWVVVSGTQGDLIFYEKRMLSCKDQLWSNLYIEYPAADKTKYDAMVAHIAASLKPGKGLETDCK